MSTSANTNVVDATSCDPQLTQLTNSVRIGNDTGRIDLGLSHWFMKTRAFRAVQAQCEALIIGQFPRHFFAQTWDYKDLWNDLVVVTNSNPDPLYTFLESEGYAREAGTTQRPNQIVYVNTDEWFDEMESRVVIHINTSIFELLRDAETTADLNFISWDKAYSMFPVATFIKKEAYVLTERIDEIPAATFQRLDREGICVKRMPWTSSYDVAVPRRRRVGDEHTWTIGLDTADIITQPYEIDTQQSEVFTAALEMNTFQIFRRPFSSSFSSSSSSYGCYVIQARLLRSVALRHDYTVAATDKEHLHRKLQILHKFLDEATMFGLAKLDEAHRPPQFRDLAAGTTTSAKLKGMLELPAGWTYHDEEAIAFLRAAWDEQLKFDTDKAAAPLEEDVPATKQGNATTVQELDDNATTKQEVDGNAIPQPILTGDWSLPIPTAVYQIALIIILWAFIYALLFMKDRRDAHILKDLRLDRDLDSQDL